MTNSAEYVIGIMSGTSLDAVDVALIDFSQKPANRLVFAMNHPLPDNLRQDILALCQPGDNELHRMAVLDRQLGELFAEAALALLKHTQLPASQILAIGSHGQTVRHAPQGNIGYSWQIGDPNTIAQRTGITTVADFRRMDVAAGGQGAPLVPAFHRALLGSDTEKRVIANIGGIGNITLLANDLPALGFDTGPGNGLMDTWIQQHLQQSFDRDGVWAASGQLHAELLAAFMAEPYLQLPAPKSTGRELFNLAWLSAQLARHSTISAADVQRTLLEFTAQSLALGVSQLPCTVDALYLCGGGARNSFLRERISALLDGIKVDTTDSLGVDGDWLEAYAFAWLAYQRINGIPANCPEVTGAAKPCLLGGIYQA